MQRSSHHFEQLKDGDDDPRKKHHKSKDYDYFMKVVLVGDCAAGKSSLLLRFTEEKFNETYVNTLGVDFRFRTLVLDSRRVKFQIWDTAGQERYGSMASTYYRGADAIIMVYDVSSQKSYDNLMEYWGKEIEKNGIDCPFKVLIGAKSDLAYKREVNPLPTPYHTIKLGSTSAKVRTIETSAKLGENIHEIFSELGRDFIKLKREQRASEVYQDGKLSGIRDSIKGEGYGTEKLAKGDITKSEQSKCSC